MGNPRKHSVKKTAERLVKSITSKVNRKTKTANTQNEESNFLLVKNDEKIFESLSAPYISKESQGNLGLMELFEVKNILNYKDMRSVIQWCSKNNVYVNHQGNRQLVNKLEFLLSFHKPFISHLQSIHKNWKEIFIHYLKGDIASLLPSDVEVKEVKSSYKPRGKSESSFLNKIKKL